MLELHYPMIQFLINIIYTRFQKGFHIERYIDTYILLFSCTCARVQFSFAIVQLVKKLGSTINVFFVGFFVPIWKEHVVCVFLEKASALQYKFAMANYMTHFWNEENNPRSRRVMRRHQIDRPNVMASGASGEAFFLTGCFFRHPPSHLPSREKKISGFENTFFFFISSVLL